MISRTNRFLQAALVAITTLFTLTIFPSLSSAQSAEAPVSLEGQGFQTPAGRVLRITILSPVPITGTLDVKQGFDDSVVATARVELPTGGEATIWIPLAVDLRNSGFTNDIVLKADGRKDLRTSVGVTIGSLPVAVLPSALGSRQRPNASSTVTGASTAEFASLTIDDLEQRPWILTGFSVLATTGRELSSASAAAQRSVMRWVNSGGELLIDDDSDVVALGKSPQPSSKTGASIGDGFIRRTAGGMRAGRWEELLYPQAQSISNFSNENYGWLTSAAIRLPPVGAMLAGMLGYIVLAGPVLHIVARKRKRSMSIWTLGPLFAIATTVVVLVGGLALRKQATDQHGLLSEFGANGKVVVLKADTRSGKHTETLKPGWNAFPVESGNRTMLTRVERPLKLDINVPPGGVELVQAAGPSSIGQSPIVATATADGGDIVLDYRNTSTRALTSVTVWVWSGPLSNGGILVACDIGVIPPGNSGVMRCSQTSFNGSSTQAGDLLLKFALQNNSSVIVTTDVTDAKVGTSFTSGKQVYSGGFLRVPISGDLISRQTHISSNGDGVQRYDLEPEAIGTATVSGEIWKDGTFEQLNNVRITEALAPNGALVSRGIITIVPEGQEVFG